MQSDGKASPTPDPNEYPETKGNDMRDEVSFL